MIRDRPQRVCFIARLVDQVEEPFERINRSGLPFAGVNQRQRADPARDPPHLGVDAGERDAQLCGAQEREPASGGEQSIPAHGRDLDAAERTTPKRFGGGTEGDAGRSSRS